MTAPRRPRRLPAEFDVASFLLERGRICAEDVVSGGLRIIDKPGRNHCQEVRRSVEPSYFVKRATNAETRATLEREAAAYTLLRNSPVPLPFLFDHDSRLGVLVLSLLPGASNLREEVQKSGRTSLRIARAMAHALAALHTEPLRGRSRIPAAVPWALSIHRPDLGAYLRSSAGEVEFLRAVQRVPEFGDLLDALRARWRRECLIHHDVRWDNWLIVREDRCPRLAMVDLEFVGPGDSAWDLGSVFASYLELWLSSIPMTGSEPPAEAAGLARIPLEDLQPSIAAFWNAYCRAAAPDSPAELLARSVRMSAARLLQTGFEQLRESPILTAGALYLLQLSLNMLRRAQDAASSLLGIVLDSPERAACESR